MSTTNVNTQVTLVDPNAIYKLRIRSRELITHDTLRFVIDLPSANDVLGTKSGQHFWVIETIEGRSVWRKYTPLDPENHRGTFEFVVKIYRANQHKDYPKGGIMTQFMENLKPGDFISIQGPIGRCTYLHNGDFELRETKVSPKYRKHVKQIGLIAGGSGLTPFLQIAREICLDPRDKTKVQMIFANHTEDDIICREEFDQLAREHPDKFKIWYTISRSIRPDWKYSIGYVTKDMIEKHMPPPGEDTLVMVCGPKPMVWECCMPTLASMGYTKDMLFKY